ncbi:hypothetical protein GCM10010211_00950 [Streptomyces albospinus]|uniref:Uncharacterized protein n=1 Tax=Streptomyces albospinus TaxID=285515 RepID=A0ABQ2ULR4_9ACTN|nr:hypothetical protein [Streptomyces albospinus]GGU41720.1 hypothetical protein GCM10010211_00950 [Streptomyces albospinus]
MVGIPGEHEVLVEELQQGIQQAVPWEHLEITPETLKAHEGQVSGFLREQWEQGALKGSAAQEAFSVQCDQKNNPAAARAGVVRTDIGIAPTRPSEFVFFTIKQTTA